MFFSLNELFDVIVMTLAIGYIFKDVIGFEHRKATVYESYDPLAQYKPRHPLRGRVHNFFDDRFWVAVAVAAPAIIVHELFHKFIALSFGHAAEFHAAYFWLAAGVILKIIGLGLVFFVPAYVSILPGIAAILPYESALIAFSGPAANLLMYVGIIIYLRYGKPKRRYLPALLLARRINGFLFIFNMLPIPFFDGFSVYSGIWHTFF